MKTNFDKMMEQFRNITPEESEKNRQTVVLSKYFEPIKIGKTTDYEFQFGKYKGKLLSDILQDDYDYIKWIQHQDFPKEVNELLEGCMDNITGWLF